MGKSDKKTKVAAPVAAAVEAAVPEKKVKKAKAAAAAPVAAAVEAVAPKKEKKSKKAKKEVSTSIIVQQSLSSGEQPLGSG